MRCAEVHPNLATFVVGGLEAEVAAAGPVSDVRRAPVAM
jgi:hypothetical protein